MKSKSEVVICLGSSCFSRGNKILVKSIDMFIKENKLDDCIDFRGAHCLGMCEKGPILKIQDEVYTSVNELDIIEILSSNFLRK